MIEDHLPLLPDHIACDVILRRRNPLHEAMEQRHVQRLGQFGARHDAGLAGPQARMDVHLLMDLLHRDGRQAAFEERGEVGHCKGIAAFRNRILKKFRRSRKGCISMDA
ncbi:hypothetical protein LP414_20140 [Polaromonas sp. P1(28)-13]|nr:hypothetical protein LP414_20140 [Polaromonas sp. P1(28)-13]